MDEVYLLLANDKTALIVHVLAPECPVGLVDIFQEVQVAGLDFSFVTTGLKSEIKLANSFVLSRRNLMEHFSIRDR